MQCMKMLKVSYYYFILVNHRFKNNEKFLAPAKTAKVIRFIEDAAARNDYDDFARYMFSVSLFESKIQFNYIHPTAALACVTPTLRPRVEDFFNRLFKFDSCIHLMNWASQSLKELSLEPMDDNIPLVSLMKWENVVRRLTFLVLHQTRPLK